MSICYYIFTVHQSRFIIIPVSRIFRTVLRETEHFLAVSLMAVPCASRRRTLAIVSTVTIPYHAPCFLQEGYASGGSILLAYFASRGVNFTCLRTHYFLVDNRRSSRRCFVNESSFIFKDFYPPIK